MSTVYGRSDIEIAEDILLNTIEIATARMISREQAVMRCTDISVNEKYRKIVKSVEALIEAQDTMPREKWITAAFKFQYTFR